MKGKTMPEKPRKVFIVDDHPVFRDGLVGLVKREPSLTICGEAENAAQALTEIQRLNPDLVLADIGLPGRSGLELIKDIQALLPGTPVLVISMYEETLYAERVLRAGGRGYIMKQAGPEKIVEAIHRVLDGQMAVTGKISARILDAFSGRRGKDSSPIACLSDREFEIFQLIGKGEDSHAIAQLLNISSKTVDAHRGRIKEKLDLKSGTELIVHAARYVEAQQRGV
jgi:DNA-binding NarL/FixJ family response regulator